MDRSRGSTHARSSDLGPPRRSLAGKPPPVTPPQSRSQAAPLETPCLDALAPRHFLARSNPDPTDSVVARSSQALLFTHSTPDLIPTVERHPQHTHPRGASCKTDWQ